MIKLGYAETDITPKAPMQLVGFNRADNTSRGVLRPLLAQVSHCHSAPNADHSKEYFEMVCRNVLAAVRSASAKGEKKLLLIRVTAHCNVLKRDNYLISPDYFGNIRELLQEKYGCPIMVIQGSAGNIAPKYFNSIETLIDARGLQYIRSNTALADMAVAVYEKLSQKIDLITVTDTL